MRNAKTEIMKSYSLEELKRVGTIKLSLGEIVSLKGLALRQHNYELADTIQVFEKKILSKYNRKPKKKK